MDKISHELTAIITSILLAGNLKDQSVHDITETQIESATRLAVMIQRQSMKTTEHEEGR